MKKIKFKNGKHQFNYQILMNLVPAELQSSAEIQAVIYFIALIECYSPNAVEYIFGYVKYLLGATVFENSNTEFDAVSLALHFWKGTYLAFREDFFHYYLMASALDLLVILDCDLLEFYLYLMDHFKDMDGGER